MLFGRNTTASLSLLVAEAFAIVTFTALARAFPVEGKVAGPSAIAGPATFANLGTVKPATFSNAVRYTLPYAQPPVGELRFANPQTLKTLPSDYNAAVQASGCIQGDGSDQESSSEDCLYME